MKAIKRTVAAILATLMLATSTSFTLAAEEYSEKEAVVVAKVNGAGIMTGTDKGFEPSKSLTRAEAAAIIVRMKGISESAVKSMAGTTLFTDVAASHWASGYVNEASNLGIVKGVSATEFAPDREVTIAEFVTMAVRALGAGQLVDSEGTWPTNYVNFANEEGILDDVTAVYTAVATRMNAATIVANTLEAPMWDKTGVKSNGEITWTNTNGKTILTDVLNIEVHKDGIVSDINIKDRKLTWASNETTGTPAKPVDSLLNKNVAECVELATLKAAISYDVWYQSKDKEVVAVFETEDSKSTTITFSGIKKIGDEKITVIENGSEVKYTYLTDDSDAIDVVLIQNGDEDGAASFAYSDEKTLGTIATTKEQLENTFGTLVLNNNKVAAIYAYRYVALGQVDKVTETKVTFAEMTSAAGYLAFTDSFKFDDEDELLYIVKNGKEITLNDLEEDDVVEVYYDDDDDAYHMNVLTEVAEGKVTAVSKNSYVSIDGTKYYLTKELQPTTITAGNEVTLYLNSDNKVIAFEDVDKDSEYAIIKSLEVVNSRKGLDLEVILGYTDGSTSDAVVLSGDSTLKLANLVLNQATNDAKGYNDAIKTAANVPYLGQLVEYDFDKDGKVELKAVTADSSAANKFIKGNTKASFVTAGSPDTLVAYVNSSTRILVVKDGAKDYNRKVTLVELDDIDTTTGLSVKAYDIENNIADFVVIDATGSKKAVKNVNKSEDWVMVIAKATIDEDDFDEEYTLVDADGKETVLKADGLSYSVGKIGIATISGDELVDINSEDYDSAAAAGTGNAYFLAKTDDGLAYFYNVVTSTKKLAAAPVVLVMSNDVLYLVEDGDDYKVSKASKLDKAVYDKTITTAGQSVDLDDANEITNIVLEKVEEDVYEIVAIVYAD